jgi:protein SCO1
VVFISVDPNRDGLRDLAGYASYFDASFIGATAKQPELATLAKALSAVYFVNPEDFSKGEKAEYTVEHSGNIHIIDGDGNFIGFIRKPDTAKTLLAQLQALYPESAP